MGEHCSYFLFPLSVVVHVERGVIYDIDRAT